ncbi:glycoside hydrolase family 88 protein [Niabella sp. W65]|nr:glycoside hydrolase family 88 protein [Niabella sp. W65]MCH7363934.1 glycoside hydrolase family 88 protein [Niabella sp. W65]
MRSKTFLAFTAIILTGGAAMAQKLPSKKNVLETLRLTNQYFMNKWPDPGKSIITNKERPSNIWTRAVYYEGLLALNTIDPQKKYYDYAVDWGRSTNGD